MPIEIINNKCIKYMFIKYIKCKIRRLFFYKNKIPEKHAVQHDNKN